jgi:hypothetical protein
MELTVLIIVYDEIREGIMKLILKIILGLLFLVFFIFLAFLNGIMIAAKSITSKKYRVVP